MARKAKETWRKVNQDIKFTSWEQINLIFLKNDSHCVWKQSLKNPSRHCV
jgi:hypothetical protein